MRVSIADRLEYVETRLKIVDDRLYEKHDENAILFERIKKLEQLLGSKEVETPKKKRPVRERSRSPPPAPTKKKSRVPFHLRESHPTDVFIRYWEVDAVKFTAWIKATYGININSISVRNQSARIYLSTNLDQRIFMNNADAIRKEFKINGIVDTYKIE